MKDQKPANEPFESKIRQIMNDNLDPQIEKRLEHSLLQFRQNLDDHPYFRRKRIFRQLSRWMLSGPRLVWTACGAVGFVIIFSLVMFSQNAPTWAKVIRTFESIPYCHATAYIEKNSTRRADKVDMWMGPEGKLRLHIGNQIVFAGPHGIESAFDAATGESVEPYDAAVNIVQRMHTSDPFSLETVIQAFSRDLSNLRPEPNRIEAISGDVSVFYLTPEDSHETIRIWTLQESLLPIRLRVKDRKTFESIDVVFSYHNPRDTNFFEAEAFERLNQDTQ